MAYRGTETRSVVEILEDYADRKELQALDRWLGETLAKHIDRLVGARQQTRYLSRAEAARILGVSTQTIDRLIVEGVLEARKVGRRVTIAQQSIDMFPRATSTNSKTEAAPAEANQKRSQRLRGGK